MNTTKKTLQFVSAALALMGWHLYAQDKSLPANASYTSESHRVSETKSGFYEYTNASPPKIFIYLHQTVHAEGDLSDTNQSDTFGVDSDATWYPDSNYLASATTGSHDQSTSSSWSHIDFLNDDGTTTNNRVMIISGYYGLYTETNGPSYLVSYACPNGGISGWVDSYGYDCGARYGGCAAPMFGCAEFMAAGGVGEAFGGCAGPGVLLSSLNQTSESYYDSTVTGDQYHTADYTLDTEYTTTALVGKTLSKLNTDTNSDGAGVAQIFLTGTETELTLGKITYNITTPTLGTNQIYNLYEQLTAKTNGVVYKRYKRICPFVSSNSVFSDTIDIQISSAPAFKVNGKVLLGQVGTNDTTVELTAARLWRIGDFDPNAGAPCPGGCDSCDFKEEPGMPTWRVSEPEISLHVSDTPATYKTSLGTPMSFKVEYDQHDPRMAGTFVPKNGWNNSWSSYVHIFGAVDITGAVDFSQWTGYLYLKGGGLSVYDYTNHIDPTTHEMLQPLSNGSPVGNGTNYGANGFRLTASDGSVDIYGLVTPVYSTADSNGLNAVDHLVQQHQLPAALSVIPFLHQLNQMFGGWSGNIEFGEEDGDSSTNSATYGGGVLGGSGGGGGAHLPINSWGPTSIAGFPLYTNEADALLTEHIDRYGNTTRFYYTNKVTGSGQSYYLLNYVVDCDHKTNTITYNANNQITNVTTPYGQTASFSYGSSQLTGITDAQGMSSSLTYDDNGVMTSMTTPYGSTSFSIWDPGSIQQIGYDFGSAQGTNTIARAIKVTRPGGSHELYAYRYDSSDVGIPSQYSPSPTGTPIGTIDDGSAFGSDSDASFSMRNSFHWGPKQCEQLSTLTNLENLTIHDYSLATMSHWLAGQYAGTTVGGTISAIVQGSPDGTNAGAATWFDYGDKVTPYQLGGGPLNRILQAQVLPDSSTRYLDVTLNQGLPASETTTYSLPDGSIGTRTYTATYTNVMITQGFTNGTTPVSSGFWTVPELLDITGPLSESRLYLSRPFTLQTITQTNYGVVSTLRIPERLSLVSINAASNTTTTYYNSRGQLTSRSAAGLTTTVAYDANGYPSQTVAVEIQRTNAYTFTNGQLTSATSPLGLVTRYSWDKLGRLTGISYPDNTSISNIYTRLDITDRKDRLGNWIHATYDSLRHRLTSTDRNGYSTTNTYCACGALESVTDPLGGTTAYDTDLNGQLTQITDVNSGRSYSVTRNILGQIDEVADSADNPYLNFYYYYNNQGLLTNVTHGYYGSSLYQVKYDIYDRPVFMADADGIWATNTYDPIGRVLTRTFPNGGVETSVYSQLGLVKRYDLNSQPTSYGYDPAGRLTSVTNANLEVTQYAYDAAGDLLTLVDGRTNTTTWTYDQYRQATKKTDANNVVIWTNGYNANGWVVSSWTPAKGAATYGYDKNGNVTNVAMVNSSLKRVYDALNRPTQIDFGNIRLTRAYTGFGAFKGGLSSETTLPISSGLDASDATRSVSYGYQNELLFSETRPDQTVYYDYDVLGRLHEVTNSSGIFRYTYNDNGNLVQSLQLLYTFSSRNYDAMGQVTNIALGIAEGQNTVAYDYDLNGNRLHVYRAKDLTYHGLDSSVTYGYDPIGQLTSALGHESNSVARLNEKFTYGYDKSGNLVARTNGALVQTFVSDPANELTNVTRNTSLTFDGNGSTTLSNVTVNSQSTAIYSDQTFATTSGLSLVNGSNSFTVVAVDTAGNGLTNVFAANLPVTQRLSYDANGNLTSDGTRGFDYDDLNQLVRVTTTNVWKTEYDYDGLRRHHARREYQWQGGGWQLMNKCYYVYAGWNVVQEVNTAEPTISYTHGRELLERESSSTNQPALFYQTDGNGNVALLFDINQQVQARYLYDAYGNLLAKSGPMADINHYRFSGKEYDQHSALYYFGYRFYEPNLQRWLNRDPIQENGGINLYGYVGNNPINYVDPLGLTDDEDEDLADRALRRLDDGNYSQGGARFTPEETKKAGDDAAHVGKEAAMILASGVTGPAGELAELGEGAEAANVARNANKLAKCKYKPIPKHGPGGFGTEMNLADKEAQEVLDKSILSGKQRYGYKDGKMYNFKDDNAGGWHGYPVSGKDVPPSVLKQLLKDGTITPAEYTKLRKGKA